MGNKIKRIRALILVLMFLFTQVVSMPARSAFAESLSYPSILFSDDFEDGNFAGWTKIVGLSNWNIVTEGLSKVLKYTYTTSAEGTMTAGETSWTDYSIESRVKLSDTAKPAQALGVIGRYNSGNYYLLNISPVAKKIKIMKKGTAFTTIAEVDMNFDFEKWYKVKFELKGTSLKGYIDDVEVISGTDDTLTSGSIGVRMYAQTAFIDDVKVIEEKVNPIPDPEPGTGVVMENDIYKLEEIAGGSIKVTEKSTGAASEFVPQFTVVYSSSSPRKGTAKIDNTPWGQTGNFNYTTLGWDGNPDFFSASGVKRIHKATASSYSEGTLTWQFENGDGYTLSASVRLPEGSEEPKITYRLDPSIIRYYSVGFTGTVQRDINDLEWIYQPAIWQGKRFPNKAYMTDESRSSIPLVMYGYNGTSVGVIADPDEMPYRLPTVSNSRFGLLLRNSEGKASPAIFAPIYGGQNSQMSVPFTFNIRLYVSKRDSYESFKYLAQNLFEFKDYRENGSTSLNGALDNLVDFIMNESGNNFVYWNSEYKAYEYVNDKPGYGRQQSAVDALSLALVRDSDKIYKGRTLPTMEFLASRKTQYTKLNGYDSSYPMGGPADGALVDWASLYLMTGGRTSAFKELVEEGYKNSAKKLGITSDLKNLIDVTKEYTKEESISNAKNWLRPMINMYNMTQDNIYLQQAVKLADDYIKWRIDQEATDFKDAYSSFWSELSPMWDAFEEIYDCTGQKKYIDAAVKSIKQFIFFIQMSPVVPDNDIIVNGETVPAWRVSEIGLLSEAAGTSNSHRGIYMPYVAAYLARFSEYSGDTFLKDLAKSNIIGRFSNYPGYTLRDNYSTKFEKPAYPLQWYSTYSNTAHMNHPMPMASMIIDYMVSDVFDRSDKKITFPSRYTDTGAYFKGKVYGDRPGNFYSDSNVWLWLPKALITTDNLQANYIAGYGNGKLYLALTNQSSKDITVTLNINSNLVNFAAQNNARLWEENLQKSDVTVNNGIVTVKIAANGITSLAIDNIQIQTVLQSKFNNHEEKLHEYSYWKTWEAFGTMVGMILSPSKDITSAFIYSDANPNITQNMTLKYSVDGSEWNELKKLKYPYEFTIPLTGDERELKYYMVDSNNRKSSEQSLWISTSDIPAERVKPLPPGETPQPEPQENIPLPMELKEVYADNFQDGNLDGWNIAAGTWKLDEEDGNKFIKLPVISEGAEEGLFLGGDNQWKDYIVEAKVKAYNKDTSGPASGIIARAADSNNFYLFRLHWSLNSVQLMKKQNGKYATLKSIPFSKTFDLDKWYALKMDLSGKNITCFVDGEEVIKFEDDSFSGGKIGVRTWNQKAAFDDFKVSISVEPETINVFSDDFEAGNAMRWTVNSGNWSIDNVDTSKAFKQNSTDTNGFAVANNIWLKDFVIEADIKFFNETSIISSGIISRYQDENNYYYLRLFSDTNKVQLFKKVNGILTMLKEAEVQVNSGQWYKLKFMLKGNALFAFVDGDLKISLIDDSFSNGAIGLYTQQESVTFDNISVKSLNAFNQYPIDITAGVTGGVFKIINNTKDTILCTPIAALYDSDSGKLLAYKMADDQVINQWSSITFPVDFFNEPTSIERKHIKVFVWDSITGMKPLAKEFKVELQK
jgi:ribosomal protein L28